MTNKKILTLITLLLFLFLLVGCDWPWTINKPPEITSDPVTTATVGVDYTYNVVATDPDGDALTYSLIDEPTGMLIGGTSGKITWKADDITTAGVGDYDVVVMVEDEEGLSDSQEFTITVSEFVVELVGIEVEPKEIEIVGFRLNVKVITSITAYYNNGEEVEITDDFGQYSFLFSSDNQDVATVNNKTGRVNTKTEGTANITVRYTKNLTVKDTIEVTVVEAE